MIQFLSFIGGLFLVWSASANQLPGLSSGTAFTSQEIRGRVHLRCQSPRGNDFAIFHCAQNILRPGEWDSFVHPEKVDGDEVTLTSHQQSGKVREKSEDYNSETGESDSFNLWIATLFQRPLLDYGLNRIDYEVTKDGIVKDIGSFDVNVERSDSILRCPARTQYSSRLSDCRSSGHQVCHRYFRGLNYCL